VPRSKRIVLLIPTLDRSGAERQLALLATGLPRERFEPHVVALTREGPYAEELRAAGVPLVCLGKRARFDPLALWRLRSLLHRLQPDLVHTWLFAANAYGRLASGGSPPWKVVVSERCVDSWKAGWQLWLDRKLAGRTDRLVGNSQAVVDFYRELGIPPEKLLAIPNGVRVEPPPSDARQSVRRELGWPEDVPVITYLGRLAPQKRVTDLLWAFELLRVLRGDDVRMTIVGDGPDRASLEAFAEKTGIRGLVAFTGHRSDASRWLAASDLVWLASDFEGQSNSLLEAQALGVPVIASDIPPNREIIRPGETGYLVPVGDRAAYSQTAHRLLGNPPLMKQLGDAARAYVAQEFSVERMIAGYAGLYDELLG